MGAEDKGVWQLAGVCVVVAWHLKKKKRNDGGTRDKPYGRSFVCVQSQTGSITIRRGGEGLNCTKSEKTAEPSFLFAVNQ